MFHQIAIDPESRVYTTITTHIGLFQYLRLHMGIAGAMEMCTVAIRIEIEPGPYQPDLRQGRESTSKKPVGSPETTGGRGSDVEHLQMPVLQDRAHILRPTVLTGWHVSPRRTVVRRHAKQPGQKMQRSSTVSYARNCTFQYCIVYCIPVKYCTVRD